MTVRLVFMGSPPIAAACLEMLVANGFDIAAVFTQPPRPSGRGKKLVQTAVHDVAQSHGLEIFTPDSLRDNKWVSTLIQNKIELGVVVAYGLVLPEPFLNAASRGFLNVHASLLPRWRGAAPIERAIEAGDKQTGIDFMQMEKGLDTGPIWLRKTVEIANDETGGRLREKLTALAVEFLPEAVSTVIRPYQAPQPQSEIGACYASKINKEELRISWDMPAQKLDQKIRAFAPAPSCWFEWQTAGSHPIRVKALMSKIPKNVENRSAEKIGAFCGMKKNLVIMCNDGPIEITLVQPSGKKRMTAAEFLAGQDVSNPIFLT